MKQLEEKGALDQQEDVNMLLFSLFLGCSDTDSEKKKEEIKTKEIPTKEDLYQRELSLETS